MTMYRVRMGGSPADSGTVFTELQEAEDYAVDWAVETAVAKGDNGASCDIYGGPDTKPWGACPAGNDGAYYPVISEEP